VRRLKVVFAGVPADRRAPGDDDLLRTKAIERSHTLALDHIMLRGNTLSRAEAIESLALVPEPTIDKGCHR
jgi:hypothetical protein